MATDPQKILAGRDVIVEFHKIGSLVKVTAMDVETLTEISVQGASNVGENMLKNNALQRLVYVLKKKNIIA